MEDFKKDLYLDMMKEFIPDSEICNVILEGYHSNCSGTVFYAYTSGVVDKLSKCSVVEKMDAYDRYVLLFTQISNFNGLVYDYGFSNYIEAIINLLARSIAFYAVTGKGYNLLPDARGFHLFTKES